MRKIWMMMLVALVVPVAVAGDCSWGWLNKQAGAVEVTVTLCEDLLMPWVDANGNLDPSSYRAVKGTQEMKIKKSEVNLDNVEVEYTYLLSPKTPVKLKKVSGRTFKVTFDPGERDQQANAATGNGQIRLSDGATCIFFNLGAVAPTEDGQACANCLVQKPVEYGGKGELAVSFRNRRKS